MRRIRSLLAAAGLLACSEAFDPDLTPEDFYGVWGADGARLTISNTRTYFESSCWAGEFAVPVIVDGEEFAAAGTLTAQGGAAGSQTVIAGLTGPLDDGVLQVTVTPPILGLGPYIMRRDQAVTILPCP